MLKPLAAYGRYTPKERSNPSRMATERKYKLTSMSAMKWAENELKHVGRIVAVEDPEIQYSYAMSTLYGMLHLKKALTELVNDSAYSVQREDLQRTLDQVVRTIKHLIKDFSLDLNVIQAFNTKKILGDLANFRNFRPAPQVTNQTNARAANAVKVNAARNNTTRNNTAKANVTRNNAAKANATRVNAAKASNSSRVNTTRKNKGFFSFLGL
jgi:hypothetical protein